jgi:hypothetical protein
MSDYNDAGDLNHLIDEGYLQLSHDQLGREEYFITEKMERERPDIVEAFQRIVANAMDSLLDKGFISVEWSGNSCTVHPLPDLGKFDELDSLTDVERDILRMLQQNEMRDE